MMNFVKKKSNRGEDKIVVDTTNKVICYQWVDNKVVNCVMSMLDYKIADVKTRIGPQKH